MKGKNFFSLVVLLCFSVLMGMGRNGYGAGFQLFNEVSARATGLGAAMTSFDDAVESAWMNPAAVAMMKRPGTMAGVALVMPYNELDKPGHDSQMKEKVYPLPYFYAVLPLKDKIGLSLSVNYPYGLTTEWDSDWIGRYYATKTELRCLFVTPSVSYKITDWLSLGVGAQIVRADAEMKKEVSPLVPGLSTKLEGDDVSSGYVLSMFAKPVKNWRVGVVFRSEVELDLDGTARYDLNVPGFFDSDMHLPLRLPASLQVGISTTIIKDWTISADFLYTWWSSYDALKFHYDKAPGTGMPGTVRIEKDWDDVYALRFGTEYRLNPAWTLRASYVFDQSPIDDATRDPSLPTNDRHLFSIGFGYNHGNFTVDTAYTYLSVEESKTSPATPTLDGTYDSSAHIINMTVQWSF